MKITDAEIIKNGEKDLIDAITADLDWGAIEEIFLKEHNLQIEEDIEYKNGDIIAVDNQVAYKLDFDVKVKLTLLLDRYGNYISIGINNKHDSISAENDNDTVKNDAENPFHEESDIKTDGEFSEMEARVDDILEKINNESTEE